MYQALIYHDFTIEGPDIQFRFSFDEQEFFIHTITLDPVSQNLLEQKLQDDARLILRAVFNLGMAEIPSYYKAFCPKKIIVRAGELSSEQIQFWRNLYYKGLGEFFYQNKIDFRGLFTVEVQDPSPLVSVLDTEIFASDLENQKVLLPIGGGKDSLVAAELLKQKKMDFTWFMLEPYDWVGELIQVSGNPKKIIAYRSIEKNFSRLSQLATYNGHVPISAVYAFSSALIALIHDFRYIAISQENSANIGNVEYLGMEINHQYSKSFEFEQSCHQYIRDYVCPDLYFFSLLRHLNELQIVNIFSHYPEYFPKFISCNKGLKQGRWCGRCPKCVFAFTTLSAFVDKATVESIWYGKNLFENPELLPLFEEMAGLKNIKPFDCVGTIEEVLYALYLSLEKYRSSGQIPVVLASLHDSLLGGKEYEYLLQERNREHLIPKQFLVELE